MRDLTPESTRSICYVTWHSLGLRLLLHDLKLSQTHTRISDSGFKVQSFMPTIIQLEKNLVTVS